MFRAWCQRNQWIQIKKCDIIRYRIKLWGQLIAYYIRKCYSITVLKHCTDVIIIEKKKKNYMDGQKATRLWIIILTDFFENIENWKKYYPFILHKKVSNINVKFIFRIKLYHYNVIVLTCVTISHKFVIFKAHFLFHKL